MRERVAMAFHDEAIRLGDAREFGRGGHGQEQRVVQTARALQDTPAAAAPAEDRNVWERIHFRSDFVRVAKDDEGSFRFPEAQHATGGKLARLACFH